MQNYTRAELLALTPSKFLAEGWLDEGGAVRRPLTGEYATAVANQLLEGELSPQELAFTIEAIRQHLPLYSGPPRERFAQALEAALETVARLIRQPNNESLVRWLQACAARVQAEKDIEALDAHMGAVLRQYAVLAAFSSEPASPPSIQ